MHRLGDDDYACEMLEYIALRKRESIVSEHFLEECVCICRTISTALLELSLVHYHWVGYETWIRTYEKYRAVTSIFMECKETQGINRRDPNVSRTRRKHWALIIIRFS